MINKIKGYIVGSSSYITIINWLDNVQVKDGSISLFQIIKTFFNNIKNDEILDRGNAVAFSFTLSVFPAILFMFTLIPYIPIYNLDDRIMEFLQHVMPHSIYEVAYSTIDDIVNKPRGGLLSFGFVLALYMATNGMMSLMKAFNQCYKTVERRSVIKAWAIAVSLTLMLAFVLFLAIFLLIIARQLLHSFHDYGLLEEEYILQMIVGVRFFVLFMMFLIAISSIYYMAPSITRRWSFFSPGSVLATLLSILVSAGFSLYINSFATYNKLYGSIGAFIALMIWLSMLSVIMLLGFELNASIDQALHQARRERLKRTKVLVA
jgi:membrane protein